jgi:hypothetical protein
LKFTWHLSGCQPGRGYHAWAFADRRHHSGCCARSALAIELAPVAELLGVAFDVELADAHLQPFLRVGNGLVVDARADFLDEEVQQRDGR